MSGHTEIAVIRIRANDDWRAVAVLDGRDYPGQAEFEHALDEAFEALDDREIPAEIETSDIEPGEPRDPLPTWEQYRQTLSGAG